MTISIFSPSVTGLSGLNAIASALVKEAREEHSYVVYGVDAIPNIIECLKKRAKELTAINGILFNTCTADMPQASVDYLAGRHLTAELEAQLEQRKKALYSELENLSDIHST